MVRRNLGLPHRLISKNFNCVIWVETEILFWREALTSQKDCSGKREMAPKISHKSLKETLQMIFRGR